MEDHLTAKPLVSVIIPAYNAENYISAALTAVLEQTYTQMEMIVVDDGSADRTLQLLRDAQLQHRFSVITQANKGAAAARNTGFRASKGSFIKFLDADDLISREMIARQVELATNNFNSIIYARWGRFYNNDTRTFRLEPEDFPHKLHPLEWISRSWKEAQSMTNPGRFLLPRTLIEQAGLWNEDLSLLDDTEYFTRTLLAANQVISSEDSYLHYRSGNPQSLSAAFSTQHASSAYQAVTQSVNYVLACANDERTRLLCANTLQSLLYTLYPKYKGLGNLLEDRIKQLGGSTLPWPASPLMQSTAKLVGWKQAKKLLLAISLWNNG